jgi:hypothetical protein
MRKEWKPRGRLIVLGDEKRIGIEKIMHGIVMQKFTRIAKRKKWSRIVFSKVF